MCVYVKKMMQWIIILKRHHILFIDPILIQ